MRECDGVRYCDVCVRMVEIEMMMRECEGDKCCEMCVQVEIGQRDDDERM